jgi:hypothetical protein
VRAGADGTGADAGGTGAMAPGTRPAPTATVSGSARDAAGHLPARARTGRRGGQVKQHRRVVVGAAGVAM